MPLNFIIPEMTIGGADWSNSTFQFYKRGFSIGGSYSPSWQEIILSGNTALTLVNAKADGLNYVKLFGATEQRYSEIPKGYTKVESITFNGTQYINTDVLTATDLTIEIEFQTSTISKCLFGGRGGSVTSLTCGIFNANKAAYVNYGGATASSTLSVSLVDGEKHKIVLSANTFTVDGNSEPYITGEFTKFYDIYLGSWNTSDKPDPRYYVGDIMSFKISNTQGVILNYIPVKNSNNVYGFYDTVSDAFITPTDGDAFTGGNVLTPSPDNRMPLWCNNGELKFGYTGTVGKNLFNVENSRLATVGVLQSDGSYYVANTTDIGYDYPARRVVFEGEENVRYTISALIKTTTAANIGIAWVYSDNSTSYGTIGNYTTYTNYNTVSVQGKTVIGFALYGSNFNNTDMYVKDCQIEAGTKATTYTPYGYNSYVDGTTETVEVKDSDDTVLGTATATDLYAVGTYKDVQSVLDGGITRNVGIKVLTGDNAEGWNTGSASNVYQSMTILSDKVDGKVTAFCSHFNYSTQGQVTIANGEFGFTSVGAGANLKNIFIRNDNCTTLTEWKQWLTNQYNAGTPVIVIYPLATPKTETVTGQTLTTKSGTNTIEITQSSIDNLGLEVSYMGGVSVTVTQVQNAQLSNDVTVTIGE